VNGEELHALLSKPVDNPIVADDDFPDVLDSKFGKNAARSWKFCETVRGAEDSVSEDGRQLWGVPSYEQADCLEIIRSLGRPPYFSHFAMRWRTFS